MSRRGFRGEVSAPRPRAAWLLVGVASAALWVTGQLAPWAMALQIAALAFSLARRSRPAAWQQSAWLLNGSLVAIVAASLAVSRGGVPATVPLAHFASLAQALQLLDARPRRTEFLLVALALFQVVLASNLTDSVWFPPLLVAFVLAAVWTLLVHTLHSEAIEAGDAGAVTRALTPGLLRVTLLASGLSILVALLLFAALPRLRSSVVSGSPLGGQLAMAGFSDTVALGDLGRIRQDPTVVLRVETLEGSPPPRTLAYWRGLAFDHFDGIQWSVTPRQRQPVPGSPEAGISLGHRPDQINLVQRIVREPVEAGVVFSMGEVRGLQGTVRRLERDANGSLYAARQPDERIRYEIRSWRRAWSDAELLGDAALPPPRDGFRHLQLPALSPQVAVLAREIAAGAPSDALRVRAIERYLADRGRYQDSPPELEPGAARSPVESFLLGELAGHCEYFASGMVVLARSLGLPARLVNGFAGGSENSIGGFLELTRSDAHAWVEVHYRDAGWVRYDPTPADLRIRAMPPLSLAARMRELGSALELWWFQRVVGFDRADQIYALKRAWLAWHALRRGEGRQHAPAAATPDRRAPGGMPLGWLAAIAAAALATAAALRLSRRGGGRGGALPRCYAAGLRLLARRGLVRGPAHTARGFARAAAIALPGPAGRAFGALTESYLRERFGGRGSGSAATELEALRAALRR